MVGKGLINRPQSTTDVLLYETRYSSFLIHTVDYRTFSDSITISLDADHEMSPEGQPMYCGYQYDIVLDDKLVERIEGFNVLAASPDATNITIQEGRAKIAVQIMDNDSKMCQ